MRSVKIILTLLLITITSSIYAQNGVLKTPEYKAHAEGWLVDINEAYAISNKTGKPIMANFTGSDWCGWCKKLKAEVNIKNKGSYKNLKRAGFVVIKEQICKNKKISE